MLQWKTEDGRSQMRTEVESPTLFAPHPNFSDEINRNIFQSEIEGGVDLRHLAPGTVLEVQTQNHLYRIVSERDGEAWISGHPVFCADPVFVEIHGSTWGGSNDSRALHRSRDAPRVWPSRLLAGHDLTNLGSARETLPPLIV